METALDRYYEACGYDKQKAIPTSEKYKELGMEDVADQVYADCTVLKKVS